MASAYHPVDVLFCPLVQETSAGKSDGQDIPLRSSVHFSSQVSDSAIVQVELNLGSNVVLSRDVADLHNLEGECCEVLRPQPAGHVADIPFCGRSLLPTI